MIAFHCTSEEMEQPALRNGKEFFGCFEKPAMLKVRC